MKANGICIEVPHFSSAATAALCQPRFSLKMEQTLVESRGWAEAHADSSSTKLPRKSVRPNTMVELWMFMVLV